MNKGIVGTVSGLVIGVAIGASVVAPRLHTTDASPPTPPLLLGSSEALAAAPANEFRFESLAKTEAKAAENAIPEEPAPESSPEPNTTEATVASLSATAPPETNMPIESRPTITLRMESAFGPKETQARAQAQRIARIASAVSEGRIDIHHFEPGQIVATEDLLIAVASGALDAAYVTPALWADRIPALTLFGALPFGPTPDAFLSWFFGGGGKAIYDGIYDKVGLKGMLCGIASAPASGWFHRALTSPDDFKDMHIRADGPAARVLEHLGANVYPLPPDVTIDAIKERKLEGAVLSTPTADLALGGPAIALHYYFPGWQQPTRLLDLVINKDRWNSLDDAGRTQLETACGDNLRYGLAQTDKGQFAALMEIAEAGVEIHRWPDSVMQKFETAWADIREDLAARDETFREGWDSLSRFREDQAIWRELARP